ncbi:MAG: hypothetical protein JNL75_06015 [Chitinophagales bacterium]|nr:hypothetical protein [Chitinophagales bacterium]
MLKVYNNKCKNCLFTQDRIVSSERAKEIIQECKDTNTHFICHLSTMENNGNICCRGFFDNEGDDIDKIQIAKRLGLVEFVETPESDKLPPYRDFT